MANTTVSVGKSYTQLTDADATNFTVQNKGPDRIFLNATTDGTAPTTDAGAFIVRGGEALVNESVANVWRGLTSPDRLWARAENNGAEVFISHD